MKQKSTKKKCKHCGDILPTPTWQICEKKDCNNFYLQNIKKK